MREKVFQILDELKIDYVNYEHNPVFHCEDDLWVELPWKRVKSLVLYNKKKTKFFMVVLEDYKRLDSRKLTKYLGESKLSFANWEYLINKIWVPAGHVSPFALLNNAQKDIRIIFDKDIKSSLLGFHPMQNDNTVVLNLDEVEKYLEYLGFEFEYTEV